MITHIISGAQTGGDQAGLDAALDLGLTPGGFVPKGRRTQAGPLTDEQMARWNLEEAPSSDYPTRTRMNVQASDATVIFGNVNSPGCRLTRSLCIGHHKPYKENPSAEALRQWVEDRGIQVLNCAGNREETNPGIYASTRAILVEAFQCKK